MMVDVEGVRRIQEGRRVVASLHKPLQLKGRRGHRVRDSHHQGESSVNKKRLQGL